MTQREIFFAWIVLSSAIKVLCEDVAAAWRAK